PKPGSPLTFFEAGRNPTDGVVVQYYLREKPASEIRLTFLDAQGNEIRSFTSEGDKPESIEEGPQHAKEVDHGAKKEPKAPAEAGMNRFVWNMRYPDATRVPGAIFWAGDITGPLAAPGHYSVQLTVSEESQTQPFEILRDPRVAATQA